MTNEIEIGTTPAGVTWIWRGKGELEAMQERFALVSRTQRAKALLGKGARVWYFNKRRRAKVVATSRDGSEVLAKVFVKWYGDCVTSETRWAVFATDDPMLETANGSLPTPHPLRTYAGDKLPKKWQRRLARRERLSF